MTLLQQTCISRNHMNTSAESIFLMVSKNVTDVPKMIENGLIRYPDSGCCFSPRIILAHKLSWPGTLRVTQCLRECEPWGVPSEAQGTLSCFLHPHLWLLSDHRPCSGNLSNFQHILQYQFTCHHCQVSQSCIQMNILFC